MAFGFDGSARSRGMPARSYNPTAPFRPAGYAKRLPLSRDGWPLLISARSEMLPDRARLDHAQARLYPRPFATTQPCR